MTNDERLSAFSKVALMSDEICQTTQLAEVYFYDGAPNTARARVVASIKQAEELITELRALDADLTGVAAQVAQRETRLA